MKKVEKSGEGQAEKEENLGEKLKRVGKKGGHSTPVIPFWRIELEHNHHHQQQQEGKATVANGVKDDGIIQESPFYIPCVSARKLGATLWELDQYKLPLSKMQHQGPPRLRRLHHRDSRQHHHHSIGGGGLGPPDPSPSSPDMPDSASSLRRHLAASLMQHHRAIERSNRAIQPVSPASYGSSMEIAPYNPAGTPTSSVDLKGRIGESSHTLKTSTELLKVLNRIWRLEEQHASNVSLIRALRKELDNAHSHIKELMRDQHADRHEIDELMKQITEDKLLRKNKEQDRLSAAIKSVRDELEDERKLRKRSESLHRKLAQELYEVKTSLSIGVKELEKERKSRKLLEDLCDEFAFGIRDYEQQLHALRQKVDTDGAERAYHDRLILHVSESWIDERMQMKQEAQNRLGEKNSVLDKLRSEIETFLQIKHKDKHSGNVVRRDRRNSLESIPLNVAAGSAPRVEDDENDSADSDSHCFELRKPSIGDIKSQENKAAENHIDELGKSENMTTKLATHRKTKEHAPSSLQVKFEEHMAQAVSQGDSGNPLEDTQKRKVLEGHPVEESISRKSEICEATEEGSSNRKNKGNETTGLSSNFVIDNLIRSHYLLSESGSMQPEDDNGVEPAGNSVWRSQPSPVRQWTDRLPSHDRDTDSSSRLPPNLKENTLKAKLIEARSRGQRSRSRLKGSKIPL